MAPLASAASPATRIAASSHLSPLPIADSSGLLHLGALASRVHVQLHLVPPRDTNACQHIAVPTTWQVVGPELVQGNGHHGRNHRGGQPSLALGVAHMPSDDGQGHRQRQWARSMSASPDVLHQDHDLMLTVTMPPVPLTSSSSLTTTSANTNASLAAIVSFRIHSPTDRDPTWLPTTKALLFSHSHSHTITIPFPPTAMSAVRIEFWPVTTWPTAKCMQSTPVHVKMIAVAGALADAAESYPSPTSLVSSTLGASPAAATAAGHVCRKYRVPYQHRMAGQDWASDEPMGRRYASSLAVMESRAGQDAPDSTPCWSHLEPNTSCRPPASAPPPFQGVRHGRISKPPVGPAKCNVRGSGIKQGDPPPAPALALDTRMLRGVSLVYIASAAGDRATSNDGGTEVVGGAERIRVAIIKTPVGMRDFVHEF